MEIGIYVTSNIRYLVWELHLGYQFLAAREVSCRHTLRWTPFSSVFWPLAGDVQGITCSLIVLTLAIHIFKLRAEGTILHAMKRFEECAQNLTFYVGGVRASMWICLCTGRSHYKMWTGLKRFDPTTWCWAVRIGADCMKLVTVTYLKIIYTRVSVTLSPPRHEVRMWAMSVCLNVCLSDISVCLSDILYEMNAWVEF